MDFERLPSFIASIVLHLAFAALVIFAPEGTSSAPAPPLAVTVSGFVTIGAEGSREQGARPESGKVPESGKQESGNEEARQVAPPPPPEPPARDAPDPAATLIPKTPEKPPEPKKPPEPQKPPKAEIKKPVPAKAEIKKPDPKKPQPKKTPAKPQPPGKDNLSNALAELRRDVARPGQGAGQGGKSGNGRAVMSALSDLGKNLGGTGEGGTGPGGSGGDGLGMLGAYHESVISRVRPNWVLPARADRKNYTAVVNIKIDKDGTILEARIVKPSGNTFFDSSVMQAVAATRTLEPPPHAGYSDIDISFTPESLTAGEGLSNSRGGL